jgi:MYXO-CTERM domain-containing protein
MALLQTLTPTTAYGCSGTTIAKVGTSGILLTAAHCVVAHDAMENITLPIRVVPPSQLSILAGSDWRTSLSLGRTYTVAEVAVPAAYDGATNSPNDVALVRYLNPIPSVPAIPALAPAEDVLAVGDTVTLVGYGQTETDSMNTVRRTVGRTIGTLTENHVLYGQGDGKGQCKGDSGGPAVIQVGGALRVAGVISYGDVGCTLLGAAVRVSSAAAFIRAFIDAATPADAGVGPDASTGADAATPVDLAPPRDTATAADKPAPPPACGISDPRRACDECIAARCCLEAAICAADPLCRGCGAAPLATCQSWPPSATLTACLGRCPGDPCGVAALLDAGRPAPQDGPGEAAAHDAAPALDAADLRQNVDVFDALGDVVGHEAAAGSEVGRLDAGRGDVTSDADAGARADAAEAPEGTGCGCATGGAPPVGEGAAVLLAAIVIAVVRRRRV